MLQLLTSGPVKVGLANHTSASLSVTSPKTGIWNHTVWKHSSAQRITQFTISERFFENMLEKWGIYKENLVCVTTDNATNMIKAFEEFGDL